jgi:hypothetical protein
MLRKGMVMVTRAELENMDGDGVLIGIEGRSVLIEWTDAVKPADGAIPETELTWQVRSAGDRDAIFGYIDDDDGSYHVYSPDELTTGGEIFDDINDALQSLFRHP